MIPSTKGRQGKKVIRQAFRSDSPSELQVPICGGAAVQNKFFTIDLKIAYKFNEYREKKYLQLADFKAKAMSRQTSRSDISSSLLVRLCEGMYRGFTIEMMRFDR